MDEETRLQPTSGIFEMFDQHRAHREGPVAILRVGDPFRRRVRRAVVRRAVVRDRDPAFLVGSVGPERLVHVVGHHSGGRRQGGEVGERGRLREQARRLGDAFGGFFDPVDASTVEVRAGETQHIDLSRGVDPEGSHAVFRTRTVGREREDARHHRSRPGSIERPDRIRIVIAEKVSTGQFRVQRPAIDVAADHTAARSAAIRVDGRDIEADEIGRLRFRTGRGALAVGPLEISAADDLADFFLRALADIAHPDVAGDAVLHHAVRAAEADRVEFLQERPRRALPRIVVRDEIALGVAGRPTGRRGGRILRLAPDRVAAGGIAVDIDAEGTREEAAIHALTRIVLVVGPPLRLRSRGRGSRRDQRKDLLHCASCGGRTG